LRIPLTHERLHTNVRAEKTNENKIKNVCEDSSRSDGLFPLRIPLTRERLHANVRARNKRKNLKISVKTLHAAAGSCFCASRSLMSACTPTFVLNKKTKKTKNICEDSSRSGGLFPLRIPLTHGRLHTNVCAGKKKLQTNHVFEGFARSVELLPLCILFSY